MTLKNLKEIIKKVFNRLSGSFGTTNKGNREEWLRKALATIPPGKMILDAGAGELQYKAFCEHLNYTSQDFSQYDGKNSDIGLQRGNWDQSQVDIVSDITSIPKPDASFDAIMCIEVLEHLPNPVNALHELCRLLKPGGTLIITAPFNSLTHFAPFFYQTGYSRFFYEHWLREFNFDIVDMQWNGNFFEYIAQELRRLDWVSEKYTGKSLNILDRIIILFMLNILYRLGKKDNDSKQLLAFGLQILARKNLNPSSTAE